MAKTKVESRVVFFQSDFAWMAIQSQNGKIEKLRFGHETHEEICSKFSGNEEWSQEPNDQESDWIEQLRNYADGERYDFSKFELELSGKTEFQKKVLQQCRQIPHGKTMSYGRLAQDCGSTMAAQAVGTIMSQNPIPIVVPCHRVVASKGLGGFSAPRGIEMKRRLLVLEGALEENPMSTENQMCFRFE